MSHVFMSYMREDSERVTRLAAELEARGAEVWLDKDNIPPGAHWKDVIRKAVEDGVFFVACFSKNYDVRERTFMNAELRFAIDELSYRRRDRAWLLPVLLDPVEVPDFTIGGMESLRDIQFLRMYENWDEAVQRLIGVIRPGIAAQDREVRLRKVRQPIHAEVPSPTKVPSQTDVVISPLVVWNPEDTVQIGEHWQEERVLTVAFSPDGGLLATGGANNTAELWSVPRLDGVRDPLRHEGMVTTVAFSPDGQVLASAGEDRTVRIWEVNSGTERHRLVHDDKIEPPYAFAPFLAFNESGSLLATGRIMGRLRVWDLSSGLTLPHIGDIRHVYGIAFRPFDRLLATAGGDGTARIWDVDSGEALKTKRHPSGTFESGVKQVTFSPDGQLLASVGQDGSARVWEIESGAEVSEMRRGGVKNVVFSQVGRRIAAACADSTVRVWEIATGDELFRIDNTGEVYKLASNPDATLFAILDKYRIVQVCDVDGGKRILDQHDAVFDVTFSPDGRQLATAGAESVRIWASRAQ